MIVNGYFPYNNKKVYGAKGFYLGTPRARSVKAEAYTGGTRVAVVRDLNNFRKPVCAVPQRGIFSENFRRRNRDRSL